MRLGVMVATLMAVVVLLGWTGPNALVQATDQTLPDWTTSYQKYSRPHALWLTADHQVGDNVGPLYHYLLLSEKQHRRPELVIYFIPERDLGESSEGGFATFTQYLAENQLLADVIRKFVQHGGSKPRVYLEPDALGHAISFKQQRRGDARSVATYQDRTRTMAQLVALYKQAGALVYLDIAHSAWMSHPDDVRRMAETLKLSGIAQADGLVTNISNRQPVTLPPGQLMGRTESDYLSELLPQLGNKALDIVIDTSRNGGSTKPRVYYLAPSGQLFDNQGSPARLVGMWRQDKAGETWFHPFFGAAKPLSRLLKKEKYEYDAASHLLKAPPWLDPIGDVQLGAAPTDAPPAIGALKGAAHVRYRDIKPPDDCDGSLNCPPGQSKSWIVQQTERLAPEATRRPAVKLP